MAKSLELWVQTSLSRRMRSEVERRLAIVSLHVAGPGRSDPAESKNGETNRPRSPNQISTTALAAEAASRLAGRVLIGERKICTAADFKELVERAGDARYIKSGHPWPQALAVPARQLDLLAREYVVLGSDLTMVLEQVQQFSEWVSTYLRNRPRADDEGARLAINLALRLRVLGGLEVSALGEDHVSGAAPAIDPGTEGASAALDGSAQGGDEQELAEELESFKEFALHFPESHHLLSTGASNAIGLRENWGTYREGSKVPTVSGASHWTVGELSRSQRDFVAKARALAVHLIHSISTRSSATTGDKAPRELIVASLLFDHSSDPGFPDLTLAREFDHAIYMALRRGWTVTRVLSRSGDELTPELQAELVNILLIDLVTPGVYRPLIDVPLTTPDAIVAQRTASISYVSSPVHADWEPRAVVRAAHWGRHDTEATRTVNGVWKDVAAALSPKGNRTRGAEASGQVRKWYARSDLLLPTKDVHSFDRALTVSELIPGNRRVLKAGFATSTIPDEGANSPSERQFKKWKDEVLTSDDPELAHVDAIEMSRRIDRLREKRRVRHFAFNTNTETHSYWDIVPLETLERYAKSGKIGDNALYGPKYLTLADRRRHLRSIQHRLEETARREAAEGSTSPGYRLALPLEEELPFNLGLTWIILTASDDGLADQVHFVHQNTELNRRVLAVLDVAAMPRFRARESFEALFDAIWNSVEPERRDPAAVAERIKDLLPRETI